MKFNKAKIVLSGIILGLTVLIMPVFAAKLELKSVSTTANKAEYELNITNITEAINNLEISVQSSNNAVTMHITRADNVTAECGGSGCKNITINETGNVTKKIATITLTNETTNQLDNLSLTATAIGLDSYTTTAVSLQGKPTTQATTAPIVSKPEITGLTVSVGTIDPAFSEDVTNYKITGIKDTINSITFNPTCENCTITYVCKENCSLSNSSSNRILLEEGANVLRVVSESADGKSKEYIFTIYRGEIEEPSAYLKDLTIKDVTLSPKFDMLLNDYTAKVDKDVEKLDITYTLEDPKATVEIKGADKLKDGENTITITVTSSDSKSKQVYTVIVTREDICDPEKEDCEKEEKPVEETKIEKKKSNKLWLIILLSVIALAIIVGSWFILFKKKKKKDKNDKNKDNKKGKDNKIKDMLIEPDEKEEEKESEETEEDLEIPSIDETLEDDILDNSLEEDPVIITPKVKPSVDEALEDLMKTKEIELKE